MSEHGAAPPQFPSRRIAAELRSAIVAGELRPGDMLPSERTLVAKYGVVRNTAREAVRSLVDEGLVTVVHGRGAFVRQERRYMRFSNRYSRTLRAETGLSPFRAEVARIGRKPDTECRSVTRVEPPDFVVERLGVDPGKKSVVRRENWYFADAEVVQVGATYIPVEIASGTELAKAKRVSSGSIYGCFAALGHEIMRTREEIVARMPTPDEMRSLSLPVGVPVLVVIHTGIDQDDVSFEVTRFVMRADTIALDYNMPVED